MQPLRVLDSVITPDGGELELLQRGEDFYIRIDGDDLMSSRMHGSEEELARLALAALGERAAPRVLVGGLGMGYTLRAALDALGSERRASVVVAELFPAVVEWNRGSLGHLAGRPLADRRVRVAVRDVGELLASSERRFDVILLDLDNGPAELTLASNRRLYSTRGLVRLHAALTPGGVLALWSATADKRFADRLSRSGFAVASHRVAARAGGKGGRHVVYVGRRLAANDALPTGRNRRGSGGDAQHR